MNLLLIGYGKMGKAIESIAVSRGHKIAGKIDPVAGLAFDFARKPDVAIEFTTPESAEANIRLALDHAVPVLSGTTGWLKKKDEIDAYCRKLQGTFFYASNYSLGVQIFFRLNEFLAKMMRPYDAYDVTIDETHHTQKKDAPSGTAITLAEGILKHSDKKKVWTKGKPSDDSELVIHSFREDPAPGTHVVKYASAIDDLEIRHTAHSREGFALGAVLVAEWLRDKKGVLGMSDFLGF